MKRFRRAGIILGIVFVIIFTGCSRSRPIYYYLYVANSNSGSPNIASYKIDDGTGNLTPIGTPKPIDCEVTSMVADHAGFRLYVALASPNIAVYDISHDNGELFPHPTTPSGGSNINSMVMDAGDKCVYAVDSSYITIYKTSYNGSLNNSGKWPGSPTYNLNNVAMAQSGFYLYATDKPQNKLLVLRLSPESGEVFNSWEPDLSTELSSPRGVAVHPSGKYIYTVNGASGKYISGLEITANTWHVQRVAHITTACTGDLLIAMDPLGRYLYTADINIGKLTVYGISSTGGLTALSTEFDTGSSPQSIAMTPNGKYVYVSNKIDNSISMFKVIGGAGGLMRITTSACPTGNYPISGGTSPSFMAISRCLGE